MQRRAFITLLSGAAIAWPFAAPAQLREDVRRVGLLTGLTADDPEGEARRTSFMQGLVKSGWTVGRDLELDARAARRDPQHYRSHAQELVALRPDVLVAGGTPALEALRAVAHLRPIVFANATDPAGGGYLGRVARPGRNTTGFMNFESRFAWKWLELLKEIAPQVTRAAILRSASSTGAGQMDALQAAAPKFGVELTALEDHDAGEIERGIAAFVHGPSDGLIVTSQLDRMLREHVVALAGRYRLPAVYPFRRYAVEGGLISYGTDQAEPYRLAAGYVARILGGERPIDLPVRMPVKYETVLNLKTATALGLDLPPQVLARAIELIE